MPLQISDKTFKRFPLPLSTSLCAYFPLYAINGSDYKSPTVELVSYFEREFLSLNNKPLVLDLSIGKSKLKPLGRFKPKNCSCMEIEAFTCNPYFLWSNNEKKETGNFSKIITKEIRSITCHT